MKLKEYIIRKLSTKDILDKMLLERISFPTDIDVDKFERDSVDIWSSISFAHRSLREWIDTRKALILRQNILEHSEGLKMVLFEWELIQQFMGAPSEIPMLPSAINTDPELKTQADILKAFADSKKKTDML